MKKIEVILSDRLKESVDTYCKEKSIEVHEFISSAIERFFECGPSKNQIAEWQAFVEMKLADMQMQLDRHRVMEESNSVFDRDLSKRQIGERDPLDLTTSIDIKTTKSIQTPKRESVVKEVDLSDLDLQL